MSGLPENQIRTKGWLVFTSVDNSANLACMCFILGGIFALSFSKLITQADLLSIPLDWTPLLEAMSTKRFCTFICMIIWFHMSEYLVTAIYNPTEVHVSSLVVHNQQHLAADVVAICEFLIEEMILPEEWKVFKNNRYSISIGLCIAVMGQVIRTIAMIQAASNFNHVVQFDKQEKHKLVTHGLYSWSRHPSYAGFVYWALGTQVFLGNPISFVVFGKIMHWFFSSRVYWEELYLVKFFGDEYKTYRKNVPTRIPLVS